MNRRAAEDRAILAPAGPVTLRLGHRLCRVEGQVRGIARVIRDERDCAEVLQQITAARRALDEVALALFEAHVRRQVTASAHGTHESDVVADIMAPVSRLVRSR